MALLHFVIKREQEPTARASAHPLEHCLHSSNRQIINTVSLKEIFGLEDGEGHAEEWAIAGGQVKRCTCD